MNSELKVLKRMWENEGEGSIRLMSKQTGLGIDYTRYLCQCLFKKEQIEPVRGKRDWYRITVRGERGLRLKKLPEATLASFSMLHLIKPNLRQISGKIEPKEKKLNLGKNIAKAVSLLTSRCRHCPTLEAST